MVSGTDRPPLLRLNNQHYVKATADYLCKGSPFINNGKDNDNTFWYLFAPQGASHREEEEDVNSDEGSSFYFLFIINFNFYYLHNTIQAKKCSEAALSLLVCMEKTECVMKKKKSLEQCMKDPDESDPCLAMRNAYYNCKHSQLNMRTRIRGIRQY